MEFKNMTGDGKAVRQLEKCMDVTENILLTGVMGTAKKSILRLLAKKMLCRGDKTESCTCASCTRMLDYHPDFKMIVPDGGVVKKEQIDGIIENSREMPQLSQIKVFLIEGGDKMNASAANALLKVLEDRGKMCSLSLLMGMCLIQYHLDAGLYSLGQYYRMWIWEPKEI